METLSPAGKLLLLWIITGRQTSLLGVATFSLSRCSFETGLSPQEIGRTLDGLPKGVRRIGDALFVRRFIAHQYGTGKALVRSTMSKGLLKALGRLSDPALRSAILEEYPELGEGNTPSATSDAPSMVHAYPIDGPSMDHACSTDTPSMDHVCPIDTPPMLHPWSKDRDRDGDKVGDRDRVGEEVLKTTTPTKAKDQPAPGDGFSLTSDPPEEKTGRAAAALPETLPPEVHAMWKEWRAYRRERALDTGPRRLGWTARAEKACAGQVIAACRDLPARAVADAMRAAIAGDWKGLHFAPAVVTPPGETKPAGGAPGVLAAPPEPPSWRAEWKRLRRDLAPLSWAHVRAHGFDIWLCEKSEILRAECAAMEGRAA